jgi:hypothetical protein
MSPLANKRKSLIRGLVVVAILIALAVAAVALFVPHCVSLTGLSAIRPGMTEQEVIALLGTPQSVSKTAPNHAQLVYSCAGRWCGVTVHLDGEGRVQSVFHDH